MFPIKMESVAIKLHCPNFVRPMVPNALFCTSCPYACSAQLQELSALISCNCDGILTPNEKSVLCDWPHSQK